jgi:hypothetical protein
MIDVVMICVDRIAWLSARFLTEKTQVSEPVLYVCFVCACFDVVNSQLLFLPFGEFLNAVIVRRIYQKLLPSKDGTSSRQSIP